MSIDPVLRLDNRDRLDRVRLDNGAVGVEDAAMLDLEPRNDCFELKKDVPVRIEPRTDSTKDAVFSLKTLKKLE